MEQLREMPRAILIAKRNVSEFWKKAHPTQPLFDGGFNFSVQYRRHALWLLLHFTSRSPTNRQVALVPQFFISEDSRDAQNRPQIIVRLQVPFLTLASPPVIHDKNRMLISARPGPGGKYHAEWYPYRDQR
jgi:hypothetical protein